MIKNDIEITELASNGMIEPFEPKLIRVVERKPVLSYGLSSYGYDIRLSSSEFRVFKHIPGTIVNPKKFNPKNLEIVELSSDEDGVFFILPAHSYGLGVSLEKFQIPNNITVVCIGKSTYARVGIIANVTPIEAAWRGHLTLEFSNSSSADCRLYVNEGIVVLLFLEGNPCKTNYSDRQGKYQDQGENVVFAKV